MAKRKTPMLDELENGKWPSFVSDIKQEAEAREKTNVDLQIPKEVCDDLLDLLELSFKDREGHWKERCRWRSKAKHFPSRLRTDPTS